MFPRAVFGGGGATLLEGDPNLLQRDAIVGGGPDSGLEDVGAGSHIFSTPDLLTTRRF